jgi:hypothetical protein
VGLAEGILPLGTTTDVPENLLLYAQMAPLGVRGDGRDLRGLLTYEGAVRRSSQVAFPIADGMFWPDKIQGLLKRDDVAGAAEVTRWPSLTVDEHTLPKGTSTADEAEGEIPDGDTGASEARLAEVAVARFDERPDLVDPDLRPLRASEPRTGFPANLWSPRGSQPLWPPRLALFRRVANPCQAAG